jgi:hypothetical protein
VLEVDELAHLIQTLQNVGYAIVLMRLCAQISHSVLKVRGSPSAYSFLREKGHLLLTRMEISDLFSMFVDKDVESKSFLSSVDK